MNYLKHTSLLLPMDVCLFTGLSVDSIALAINNILSGAFFYEFMLIRWWLCACVMLQG